MFREIFLTFLLFHCILIGVYLQIVGFVIFFLMHRFCDYLFVMFAIILEWYSCFDSSLHMKAYLVAFVSLMHLVPTLHY